MFMPFQNDSSFQLTPPFKPFYFLVYGTSNYSRIYVRIDILFNVNLIEPPTVFFRSNVTSLVTSYFSCFRDDERKDFWWTSRLTPLLSTIVAFPESTPLSKMKLLRVVVFLVLLVGVLSSVSNINLSPTGNYPPISTKGGLGVSIAILIYMLFSELGYLPFKFQGRKRRSAVGQLTNPLMLGDRDNILKLILSMDRQSCLLRFLCELEGSRHEAEKNNLRLDPDLEEDLILLKVAKRKMHPAELMRQDPGSPALPFEIAVFTGSEGLNTCAGVFQACPYNITTMQGFLGEDFNHL